MQAQLSTTTVTDAPKRSRATQSSLDILDCLQSTCNGSPQPSPFQTKTPVRSKLTLAALHAHIQSACAAPVDWSDADNQSLCAMLGQPSESCPYVPLSEAASELSYVSSLLSDVGQGVLTMSHLVCACTGHVCLVDPLVAGRGRVQGAVNT